MEDVGMDVVQVTRERITFIPIFFIQINVLLGLKYSILSRVIWNVPGAEGDCVTAS